MLIHEREKKNHLQKFHKDLLQKLLTIFLKIITRELHLQYFCLLLSHQITRPFDLALFLFYQKYTGNFWPLSSFVHSFVEWERESEEERKEK